MVYNVSCNVSLHTHSAIDLSLIQKCRVNCVFFRLDVLTISFRKTSVVFPKWTLAFPNIQLWFLFLQHSILQPNTTRKLFPQKTMTIPPPVSTTFSKLRLRLRQFIFFLLRNYVQYFSDGLRRENMYAHFPVPNFKTRTDLSRPTSQHANFISFYGP